MSIQNNYWTYELKCTSNAGYGPHTAKPGHCCPYPNTLAFLYFLKSTLAFPNWRNYFDLITLVQEKKSCSMFFYSSLGAVRLRHGWSSKQDERRKQVVAARRVVLVRVGESFSGLLSPAGPPARHGGSNPVHALFTWPPHRAGPISPQPQAWPHDE